MEEAAYDLLYNGSKNKFRSVTGICENRYEVSVYLAKQISFYLDTSQKPDQTSIRGIITFFKGANSIEFYDLWEKVITLFIVIDDRNALKMFTDLIHKEISKIDHIKNESIATNVSTFLLHHLNHCEAMAYGLAAIVPAVPTTIAEYFRKSNMIRHHYVRCPLLNYTDYDGSLIGDGIPTINILNQTKLDYTPRYIHFEELVHFGREMQRLSIGCQSESNITFDLYQYAHDTYEKIHKYKYLHAHTDNQHESYSVISMDKDKTPKNINIAIVNLHVNDEEVLTCLSNHHTLFKTRLKELNKLLNQISSYRYHSGDRIDVVVFPELSIPRTWLPTLNAWSRKEQIGLVGGLEYRVEQTYVWNEVIALMPFKDESGYRSCIPVYRLKRHYAPAEVFDIKHKYRLMVPTIQENYWLLHWHGIYFTLFDCYELADIADRCKFKGLIDLLIVTELNRDVNYFSNIVESTVRDLHCYIAQANTSKYGDTRILQPTRTESMDMVTIKGGDNTTFLATTIDIQSLRQFQKWDFEAQRESSKFKPTPPGFPIEQNPRLQ